MIAFGQMTAPKSLPLLIAFAALGLPSAVGAQDNPDALIDASRQVDTGLALANRQIAANDLLGALGTLERVQFAHPEAVPPRLLYVSLLCRLDDREGAEVEIGFLAGKGIAEADMAPVMAACGPFARTAPPRKGRH